MLTERHIEQLRYEIRRKFMTNIEHALDDAIDKAVSNGVELGNIITINIGLHQRISNRLSEGRVQLEKIL